MPSSVSRDDLRGIRKKLHFLRGRHIILSLWAGLLIFASIGELLPGDSAPIVAVSDLNDKFIHFSVYAFAAFVPAVGLRLRTAVACIITTELVGIGLEFAQLFVPERSCDPYDMAANTTGVIVGVILALIVRSRVVEVESDLSHE